MIILPFPNLNDGLAKPLPKLGNGWVINSHFYVSLITYPCPSLSETSHSAVVHYFEHLFQDCSNSIADALGLQQCTGVTTVLD